MFYFWHTGEKNYLHKIKLSKESCRKLNKIFPNISPEIIFNENSSQRKQREEIIFYPQLQSWETNA